jgi:hypothetical protein
MMLKYVYAHRQSLLKGLVGKLPKIMGDLKKGVKNASEQYEGALNHRKRLPLFTAELVGGCGAAG